MKKALLLASTISFILFGKLACAEPCGTLIGNTQIGKVTLQCTQITGNATLTNTTLTGKLTLLGSLNASHAKFTDLDVTGNVEMLDSIITGSTAIIGQFNATNSTLNDISIQGDSAQFKQSTTGNITLSTNRTTDTPTIVLTEGSVVNGNITFTHGHGIVENNHAKINGKILGGELK